MSSSTTTTPRRSLLLLLALLRFALLLSQTVPVTAFGTTATTSRQVRLLPTSTTTSRPTASTRSETALGAQIISDIVNDYQYFLTSYPLETQSATFGTFAGVGDVLAQKTTTTEEDEDEGEVKKGEVAVKQAYDPRRSARFVLKGLGAGLIWSAWYPFADGWSTDICADVLSRLDWADTGTIHTVVKTASSILLEQFVACPIVYSLWDIPVPTLLAGAPPSSIPRAVREKVPGLLLDNAKVWTFANVIIYNLPVEWRVFAVSVAEIFWASIVSQTATKKTSTSNSGDAVQGSNGMDEGVMEEVVNRNASEKMTKVMNVGMAPRSQESEARSR